MMKKVTRLDFQIMMLERLGPRISEVEKLKLGNLKEQKDRLAELGIEMKATMVPRFPSYCNLISTGASSGQDQVQELVLESVNSEMSKDVNEAPIEAASDSREIDLNGESVPSNSDRDASEVRSDIKKKSEKAHQNKLLRDKVYQKQRRGVKAMEKAREKVNIKKLETMIAAKIEKKERLKDVGEELQSRLISVQVETKAVLKLIKESEKSENIMKEKYKLVFKHHSKCMQT